MKIDWFTIIAQALNFLILVWLMKRFLYRPIRHAIDEREKRIAAELANADKMKATAQKQSDDLKQKNLEFDQQRAALLSKATDEAQGEREKLLDEAKKASVALSLKQQEALKSEEHNLLQSIGRRTQQEVFSIARKALTDLAGTTLEERMIETFIRRLHDLDEEKKTQLTSAFAAGANKTHANPVIVRTAFDLPPAQHAATEAAIKEFFGKEIFGNEIQLQFETAPNLIGGIEITMNGQKIAWNIADYLGSLEKGVDELLKKKDKPKANVKPLPEVKAVSKPVENKVEAKSP